jgi:Ferritin-like domain
MEDLTLDQIDVDGAVDEALHGLFGLSRATFLRSAALVGGAFIAGLASAAQAAELDPHDIDVLNFDLTFEHLQAGFYDEALRFGALDEETTRWARVIGAHERAHVEILSDVLGRRAVKKPFFDYQGVTEDKDAFTKTAVAMEDLTTDLLIGQLNEFRAPALVSAVFSLLSVEARHAAWVRHVVGVLPVARPLDQAKSLTEVSEVIRSTRFMKENPVTWAKTAPRFTG